MRPRHHRRPMHPIAEVMVAMVVPRQVRAQQVPVAVVQPLAGRVLAMVAPEMRMQAAVEQVPAPAREAARVRAETEICRM